MSQLNVAWHSLRTGLGLSIVVLLLVAAPRSGLAEENNDNTSASGDTSPGAAEKKPDGKSPAADLRVKYLGGDPGLLLRTAGRDSREDGNACALEIYGA